MGILDFLALPGQERTRRRDEYLGGLLNYYLGPTGIPERLGLVDMMNPVSDVGRAMTSSQEMLAPGRAPMERVGAGATMLTDMAGVAAPMVATRIAGGDATKSMVEGLLGMGGQTARGLDDAARRFAADESGALTLWHGSPHDFDRFSMDKIGTGEGAQAYGHGLYFAEARPVAEGYRDQLARGAFRDGTGLEFVPPDLPGIDGKRYRTAFQALQNTGGNYQDARDLVGDDYAPFFDDMQARGVKMDTAGRLYEVSVDANPEDFLDWDAPLSAQPQRVREVFGFTAKPTPEEEIAAFELAKREMPESPGNHPAIQEVYARQSAADAAERRFQRERSVSDPAAATSLKEFGIPGIRYLDAGSRGAGDGSRNYVVFDENLISIIRKYGIAGAAAMLGMSQADLAQAMEQQQQPQGLLGGPR